MSECRGTFATEAGFRCPESRNGNHFCTEHPDHRCLHQCPCGVKWTDPIYDEGVTAWRA